MEYTIGEVTTEYTLEQIISMRIGLYETYVQYAEKNNETEISEKLSQIPEMSIEQMCDFIKHLPGTEGFTLLAKFSPILLSICFNTGIALNKVDPLFEALAASKYWEQALAKSLVSKLYYSGNFWKPLYMGNKLSFSEWNSRFQKYLCASKEASIPLRFFYDAMMLIYTLNKYRTDTENPLSKAEYDFADSLIALLYTYN